MTSISAASLPDKAAHWLWMLTKKITTEGSLTGSYKGIRFSERMEPKWIIFTAMCFTYQTLTHSCTRSESQGLHCCPMLELHQMDYRRASDAPAGRGRIHSSVDCQAWSFIFIFLFFADEKRPPMHPSRLRRPPKAPQETTPDQIENLAR